MNKRQLIFSLTDGHSGCLQIFATTNQFAVNVHIYTYPRAYLNFLRAVVSYFLHQAALSRKYLTAYPQHFYIYL